MKYSLQVPTASSRKEGPTDRPTDRPAHGRSKRSNAARGDRPPARVPRRCTHHMDSGTIHGSPRCNWKYWSLYPLRPRTLPLQLMPEAQHLHTHVNSRQLLLYRGYHIIIDVREGAANTDTTSCYMQHPALDSHRRPVTFPRARTSHSCWASPVCCHSWIRQSNWRCHNSLLSRVASIRSHPISDIISLSHICYPFLSRFIPDISPLTRKHSRSRSNLLSLFPPRSDELGAATRCTSTSYNTSPCPAASGLL